MRLIAIICGALFTLSACADYDEARHAYKQGDYQTAEKHYAELSEFGHSPSQVALARMYIRGEGAQVQPEQAAQLLKQAAAKGNPKAYLELGRLYERGEGVEQSAEKAAENYQMAIDAGYINAAFDWGRMLVRGRITPPNIPNAMALYEMSAQNGYGRSALGLAQLIPEHSLTADMKDISKNENVTTNDAQNIMTLALFYAAQNDDRKVPAEKLTALESGLSTNQKDTAYKIAKKYYSDNQAWALQNLITPDKEKRS